MTTYLPVRQRTPEWEAVRRASVTGTDIPVILGLSPWKSEGELAREKGGLAPAEPGAEQARAMRLGLAMEDVIRREDILEHGIDLRRVNRLVQHPVLPWAVASLDFERVGERVIVEAKTSSQRSRFGDELPQDVESQVRWQMGCAGYPRAHVAALVGHSLRCYDLEHDDALFEQLVAIADDFRMRLTAGGPFAESLASVKALYPRDDGSELSADGELIEAVAALVTLREQRKRTEESEAVIEAAIKARMGEASTLVGPGFHVTWKRTRDSEVTDWKNLATGLLTRLPETERVALVGLNTTVREGFRPFRVTLEKES